MLTAPGFAAATLKMNRLTLAASKLWLWLLPFLLSVQSYDNMEGDALIAFKAALEDPNHVLESWDPSLVTACTWFHISCNSNNAVVRVDLGNASLKGSLVPELGKLSQLQYFELHDNYLTGSIPSEFGNLRKLVSLDLYNNHLTGKIPATFGHLSHLRYLRMNNNNLSGIIPTSLTTLPLQVLDLSYNNLDGPVPTNGSFSSLAYKNFTGNPHLCTKLCPKSA